MLPTDQRKCTLTECWAVLTYSICPNKSVNRKCTWYRNNLWYTKKIHLSHFFHLPSQYNAEPRWEESKEQSGGSSLFSLILFYAVCPFSGVYLPLVVLFICLLYLLAHQHSVILKLCCGIHWGRWGCCECTMLLFLQSCLFNEVKLFTSTEKYLNLIYIQRSGYGHVYYLFRFWLIQTQLIEGNWSYK